jgi:hypothetical protein
MPQKWPQKCLRNGIRNASEMASEMPQKWPQKWPQKSLRNASEMPQKWPQKWPLLGLLSPVQRIAAKPNTSVAMLQNAPTRMPHTRIPRTETMVIADAQSHTPNTLRKPSSLPCWNPARSDDRRAARARLLSCACHPALAWLDTLPLTPILELKSGEVQTSLRHRLGLNVMPPNVPTQLCSCGAALSGNTADYTMRCLSVAALTTLHHGILKGILRRVVH